MEAGGAGAVLWIPAEGSSGSLGKLRRILICSWQRWALPSWEAVRCLGLFQGIHGESPRQTVCSISLLTRRAKFWSGGDLGSLKKPLRRKKSKRLMNKRRMSYATGPRITASLRIKGRNRLLHIKWRPRQDADKEARDHSL